LFPNVTIGKIIIKGTVIHAFDYLIWSTITGTFRIACIPYQFSDV